MITTTTRRLAVAIVILVPSAFFTGQLLAESGGAIALANSTNHTAISMFMVFVLATLGITYWAARRTHSTDDYYAAGGGISGTQNGFAIAGDFMSAASFLGASGLIYTSGYDALIYAVGGLAGWPLVLFIFAERLRNLGRYTFTDVVSFRLQAVPIRTLSALSTLVIVTLYLIAQMVGAGALVQILFGLPYEVAVVTVGILMILYVSFGGMIATTWVQIVKAALLLFGSTVLAYLVMGEFGFSLEALFFTAGSVHPKGEAIFASGGLVDDPISTISLGLALVFGTAGLPHILMRFFTVPDAGEARKSALVATCLIGYFYILVIVLGFGTIGVLTQDPSYSMDGELRGGSNMAVIHLSQAIAGDLFMGFISAVAFATILAVVSGLALSGASAIAHDVYTNIVRKGKAREQETIMVSRLASVALGIVAIFLGIVFRGQNVAYMVVLAFAVSASVNFPILFLSMYWRKLTTRGAVWGGSVGLVSAVTCIVLGPTFWVEILGNAEAIFPFRYPALFSMSGAFLVAFIVSKLDRGARVKEERDAFDLQYLRSVTGVGSSDPVRH